MCLSKKEKEKIFKNIRENGYSALNNIYSKKQLNNVKDALVNILNYIVPDDKIKNLHKKYYQVKERSMKLKGHFFDMTSFDMMHTR